MADHALRRHLFDQLRPRRGFRVPVESLPFEAEVEATADPVGALRRALGRAEPRHLYELVVQLCDRNSMIFEGELVERSVLVDMDGQPARHSLGRSFRMEGGRASLAERRLFVVLRGRDGLCFEGDLLAATTGAVLVALIEQACDADEARRG